MSPQAADKRFDLGDYVEVKDRIKVFYELFGNGRLCTAEVTLTSEPDGKPRVMVKAFAYRTPDDPHPGVGYSWLELPGSTPYTRGSEVENAETSAWGRAIGSLGILIDRSIASRNEINNKTDEPSSPAPSSGGLIGVAEAGAPPADFEVRNTPSGIALAFRLKDGRKGFRVDATDALAVELFEHREAILGQRVTAYGTVGIDSWTPKGKSEPVRFATLALDRLTVGELTLPAAGALASGHDDANPPATAEASSEPQPVETPAAPSDTPSLEATDEPVEPEAQGGASEPVTAPVEADAAPGPSDLCGSASPFGTSDTCQAQRGHAGKHVSFEGLGTSWPAR